MMFVLGSYRSAEPIEAQSVVLRMIKTSCSQCLLTHVYTGHICRHPGIEKSNTITVVSLQKHAACTAVYRTVMLLKIWQPKSSVKLLYLAICQVWKLAGIGTRHHCHLEAGRWLLSISRWGGLFQPRVHGFCVEATEFVFFGWFIVFIFPTFNHRDIEIGFLRGRLWNIWTPVK